ncbi:universal stress protein [Umezawaea sp. Da 62-37]|uniref:universal stress protein n=1 Tax=Umezawaea sp. Da 62-37 TaxID=3075927 RepID=UPI0028F6E995|nr:universal stress protein [Umezawaea sp. Da 62-37]WNV88652.1 universal stress protein [Umezawaea sp. Da 62-37]
MHLQPDITAVTDQVRSRFPDLAVRQRYARDRVGDLLVAESEHAHLIAVADEGAVVFEGESVITALSALARCPVVSVPPGAAWTDPAAPVIVGVHASARSREKLEFSFAEADRLGTGARLVRCASRGPADDLLREVSARYPDVPVHSEVLGTPAASAVAWHAHFGSMVVLGSRRGGAVRGALVRSISRAVLRHASSPVVVIGPSCRRFSPAVSDLDNARS